VEERDKRFIIHQPDDWIPLNQRIIKEHDLAFQLEGNLVEAPQSRVGGFHMTLAKS
jgi:hypothetical protein